MGVDVRRVGVADGAVDAVAAFVAGGVHVAALLGVGVAVAEEVGLAANRTVAAGDGSPVGAAAREVRVLADEAAGLHDLVPRMGCVLNKPVPAVAENGGCSGYFLPYVALGLVPWLPTPLYRVDSTRVHDQYGGPGRARTN